MRTTWRGKQDGDVTMLFHVSEDAGINRFEPRPSEYTDDPVVWAIDDERLRNYLLPRDCPRVTYYAGPKTTDQDRQRFLGAARALVAIEESWLERVRGCVLYCYRLPPETFVSQDDTAGYHVSRQPVVPEGVRRIDAPLDELSVRGVEVRLLPNLWPLRDAVIASTLEFSIIRMRKALPRIAHGRGSMSEGAVSPG
jgi:hypothetical protein